MLNEKRLNLHSRSAGFDGVNFSSAGASTKQRQDSSSGANVWNNKRMTVTMAPEITVDFHDFNTEIRLSKVWLLLTNLPKP